MQQIPLEPRLLQGCVSCRRGDGWIEPWRLDVQRIDLYPDPGFRTRAACSAGVRIRLQTDATTLSLQLPPAETPPEDPRRFDLVIDNRIARTVELAEDDRQARFDDLPAGTKTLEIYLPQFATTRLAGLEIDDNATVSVPPDDRPRWVTYGSSITQARRAASPARTWPATAARLRNCHLTCLGYAGQCHLDGMVAMHMRSLPADCITLKLGINMHGGSVSPRTFREMILTFVTILRDAHPEIPIALVSPIVSPPREQATGKSGYTLQRMREHVADAADRLAAAGDPNIHYFDGLDLFGYDLVADYLPDQLHPNAPGHERLGHRFASQILTPLHIGQPTDIQTP